MKIKYRKNVVFGVLAGILVLMSAGCGLSFCGIPLTAENEMVFRCAEAEGDSREAAESPDLQAGEALEAQEQPESEETSGPDRETQPDGDVPDDGKVDLNSAGMDELMTLNGIGESRAAAIIEFREQNGPFVNIEEIMMIPGIKEGIFSRIKDQIVVR